MITQTLVAGLSDGSSHPVVAIDATGVFALVDGAVVLATELEGFERLATPEQWRAIVAERQRQAAIDRRGDEAARAEQAAAEAEQRDEADRQARADAERRQAALAAARASTLPSRSSGWCPE